MEPESPLMKQWRAMRDTLPANVLLLFRLGDFYELFSKDADDAAMITGLGLTRRNGISMCGFPVHAEREYIRQLLKAGRKVAIAEQTEAPVPGKLTERQIREVAAEVVASPPVEADAFRRLVDLLKHGTKRYAVDRLTAEDLRSLLDVPRPEFFASMMQAMGGRKKPAQADILRRMLDRRQEREAKAKRKADERERKIAAWKRWLLARAFQPQEINMCGQKIMHYAGCWFNDLVKEGRAEWPTVATGDATREALEAAEAVFRELHRGESMQWAVFPPERARGNRK